MAKLRVMLAEDDPTMVNLLKTLLRMEGFEVLALDAQEDVARAVGRACPDILLKQREGVIVQILELLETGIIE